MTPSVTSKAAKTDKHIHTQKHRDVFDLTQRATSRPPASPSSHQRAGCFYHECFVSVCVEAFGWHLLCQPWLMAASYPWHRLAVGPDFNADKSCSLKSVKLRKNRNVLIPKFIHESQKQPRWRWSWNRWRKKWFYTTTQKKQQKNLFFVQIEK